MDLIKCTYCTESTESEEYLTCNECYENVHIKCLKRPGTPGDLHGDIFFEFICSSCGPNGQEKFIRQKLPWLMVIVITLHNLTIQSKGLSHHGFFHWRTHIASFIDKNWNFLFTPSMTRKKKWHGTISGTLSHHSPQFFLSGYHEISEAGWWKLKFNEKPKFYSKLYEELSLSRQQLLKAKKRNYDEENYSTSLILDTKILKLETQDKFSVPQTNNTFIKNETIKVSEPTENETPETFIWYTSDKADLIKNEHAYSIEIPYESEKIIKDELIYEGEQYIQIDETQNSAEEQDINNILNENSVYKNNISEAVDEVSDLNIVENLPKPKTLRNEIVENVPKTTITKDEIVENVPKPKIINFESFHNNLAHRNEPSTSSMDRYEEIENEIEYLKIDDIKDIPFTYPTNDDSNNDDDDSDNDSDDDGDQDDGNTKWGARVRIVEVINYQARYETKNDNGEINNTKSNENKEQITNQESQKSLFKKRSEPEPCSSKSCDKDDKISDNTVKFDDKSNTYLAHSYRKLQSNSTKKSDVEESQTNLDKYNDPTTSEVTTKSNPLDRYYEKSFESHTRICGTLDNEFFESPYTTRILHPFIYANYEAFPTWLKVMSEIKFKVNGIYESRSTINFCYLRHNHVPAVNTLLQELFWPGIDMSECLSYPEFTVVALYKKLLVGCAFLVPDVGHSEAYISFLAVRPGWQRCGIASFMLYHLTQTCMSKDITLHVSVTNSAAVCLYQKFGFKIKELVLDFYEKYLPMNSLESRHALFLRLTR